MQLEKYCGSTRGRYPFARRWKLDLTDSMRIWSRYREKMCNRWKITESLTCALDHQCRPLLLILPKPPHLLFSLLFRLLRFPVRRRTPACLQTYKPIQGMHKNAPILLRLYVRAVPEAGVPMGTSSPKENSTEQWPYLIQPPLKLYCLLATTVSWAE